MSDYLTATELAELIGCKPNQRALMVTWLVTNHWKHVLSKQGLPRVLREYRNRKLGLIDDTQHAASLEVGPNVDAFRFAARTNGRAAAV